MLEEEHEDGSKKVCYMVDDPSGTMTWGSNSPLIEMAKLLGGAHVLSNIKSAAMGTNKMLDSQKKKEEWTVRIAKTIVIGRVGHLKITGEQGLRYQTLQYDIWRCNSK